MSNGNLTDINEAERRYSLSKSKDPFPEIAPALLNSADIHDYVVMTGMICPYEVKQLKSASYELKFCEGKIINWGQDNRKQSITVGKDDTFEIKKNSIVFVRLNTKIQLPDYIALRFNLQIQAVHAGLLLGTGPLIDPGFVGNILIPVHNLTANDYKFNGDDGFIWVEFTKTSSNSRWKNDSMAERHGEYVPFPERKINKSDEYYFERANKNNPIQSSIPMEVKRAEDIALKAEGIALKTEKTVNTYKKIGWISLLSIIVAIVLSLIPIVGLVRDSIEYVTTVREEIKKEVEQLKKELADIKSTSQKQSNNLETDRSEDMKSPDKSKQESSKLKDEKRDR